MIYSPFANTVHKVINDVYQNSVIKYLELGLNCGTNFNSLMLINKVSVDIKFEKTRPSFLMTTDNFFEQNEDKFDLIYIDADHEYTQVIKDFNNSVKYLNKDGIIFLHDLFPPDEYHTSPNLCHNSYKILNYLISNNYDILINREDYGACSVFKALPINIEKFNHNFSYEDLINKYKNYEMITENYAEFLQKYRLKIKNNKK